MKGFVDFLCYNIEAHNFYIILSVYKLNVNLISCDNDILSFSGYQFDANEAIWTYCNFVNNNNSRVSTKLSSRLLHIKAYINAKL